RPPPGGGAPPAGAPAASGGPAAPGRAPARERAAPRDDLVGGRVEVARVPLARRERAELLEVVVERQPDGGAHVGEAQLARDEPQLLDGARAALRAVADEAHGLVGPLVVEPVHRVLQHGGPRVGGLGGPDGPAGGAG